MKKLFTKHKELLLTVFAVIILYGIFTITGIGCPIKYFTGISCAGCGMTRAFISLIKGDILGAFYFHPLWVAVIPATIFIMCKGKINKRIYNVVIGIIVVLFMVVYLVRMLNPSDIIVVFEPENNIFSKLFGVWRR